MFGFIITGAIALPLIILAIFLLNGKGAFFIAGWNTMSSDKKAAYDEKAICKATGWLLLMLSAIMMLWPLGGYIGSSLLIIVSSIIFLVLTFGFVFYVNISKRFRSGIEPGDLTTTTERKPMSRGKKVAIVLGIVLSAQVFIGMGIMFYQGERDPRVTINNDHIRISSLYGRDISLTSVAEITLINSSMKETGIGRRTNGYSSGGPALKGYFNSMEHGTQVLFVYATSSPTIKISQNLGGVIYISFRNSDKTVITYQELSTAMQN